MQKHFIIFGLLILGAFSVDNVRALPAPSALSAREHRVTAAQPTPTATPVVVTRTVAPTPVVVTRTVAPQAVRPSPERPPAERPSTVIVIDAGHGGFDRGGIAGQRVSEKMMNLDVAQRLRTVLQAYGYRVVMTRDTDVFLPLGTRVAIANQYRDAIFVCVHFNATPRRSANGIETYFYSSQSLSLASAIHYYVNRVAPTPNRGVRRRGFYVLRNTRVPSVLVECGFLTNPTEAEYAQSTTYRQQLADAIARGVRERSLVASTSSSNRLAANTATVPLQPFIDQTHYRDPDLVRHRKRSSKSSSKSTSSSKRKKASGSDSTAKSSTKKKKSSSAQAED